MNALQKLRLISFGYLALFGAAVALWLSHFTPLPLYVPVVCAAPALLAWWVVRPNLPDRKEAVARACASVVMTPILLLMWAASLADEHWQPSSTWIVIALGLLHLGGFVGFIFAANRITTRISAQPRAPRVTEATLRARVESLARAGLPIAISHGDDEHTLIVELTKLRADRRSLHVFLRFDETQREVRVRERLAAHGAAPRDAGEADMRAIGQLGYDPTRPKAQRVYSHEAQTSILEPARISEVPLQLVGERVELPAEYVSALDEQSLVELLCALCTRSGYAFCPVFFSKG